MKKKLMTACLLTITGLFLVFFLYYNSEIRWVLSFLPELFNQEAISSADLEKAGANFEKNYPDTEHQAISGTERLANIARNQEAVTTKTKKEADNDQQPGQDLTPGSVRGEEIYLPQQIQREIESYYLHRLKEMALTYEGKLNALVAQGYTEYQNLKKQNCNAPLTTLSKKYLTAGSALEAECDTSFYSLLNSFRKELKKHSLPTEIVNQVKEEYERTKAARKREILSKALKI